ncbi:MAG TPA: MFS transporter, partial [Stellaceae bacterium]|nr:MFS transporter [Stellaceae bacterium]
IFPYFPFSAPAGQLADKFEKTNLIRLVKLWEVGVMVLAAIGLTFEGWSFISFEFAVLFFLGVQATFFGPVKYGILPDLLEPQDLMGGNALIEAGTFLAILLGTIAGGLLSVAPHGRTIVGAALLTFAVGGWVSSFFIPPAKRTAPELRINPNVLAETFSILRTVSAHRDLKLSIIALSWFWLFGAIFLSQFPTYAKETFHANAQVETLFLAMFSIGIGAGAVLCGRLLRGEVSARLAPIGAVGMTLFTLDLYLATVPTLADDDNFMGVLGFLSSVGHWRVLFDLLMIALSGGLFTVPLYALLQARAEAQYRSRVIAANNIANAIFIVVGGLASAALLALGLGVPAVFLTVGLLNAVATLVVVRLLPGELLKILMAGLFRLFYRVEVRGLENLAQIGERAVFVANHLSFLDGPLIAAFLPGRPAFAIDTAQAERWLFKPFLALIDAVSIDPTKPMATKTLIRVVEEGRQCVIFPEGRITVTGALMKIYEGPGLIADKAKAAIVPIRLEGAQYTPFSRLKGKVRLRWFPKITLTIEAPQEITVALEIKGRKRRRAIGQQLYDIMSETIFATAERRMTLFQALLDARAIYGSAHPIIEDNPRHPLGYGRLIAASLVLARQFAPRTRRGERVGVLLPSSVGAVATFFALTSIGRVSAMLNFSTGAHNMEIACRAAEVTTIITSRLFVARGKLDAVITALSPGRNIVYLEDLRARIGWSERLRGLLGARFPGIFLRHTGPDPDD